MPAALDVNWPEVRRAAEMGADLRIVAAKFGISIEAVRKRAQREQWLTPNKLAERLAMAKANGKQGASELGVSPCQSYHSVTSLLKEKAELKNMQDKDTTETALKETLEYKQELIQSQEWLVAQKSLKNAIADGLMITNIKEAKTAFDMGRRAVGLDKPEPMLTMSIFGEQGGHVVDSVMDASSGPILDIEDEDDWV